MGAVTSGLSGSGPARSRRAGLRTGLLAVVVSLSLIGSPARAQDPTVPTTPPADTVELPIPPEAIARDTLPGDSLMPDRDSIFPAARLPVLADPLPTGWAFARWEWSRDELKRHRGLTVLELIERLPGLHSIRAGAFGRPAGVAPVGLGGSSVRIYIDGYHLEPLGSIENELQAIGLIDLDRLVVARTGNGVRIDLHTFTLPDSRAYSEVEAGAGNYSTRLLRATLARAAGRRSTVTGAYDLVTTNGVALTEPYQGRSARLRWVYQLSPSAALRLDLQQMGADREGTVDPIEFTRRDITLRGRVAFGRGFTAEALAGRSTWWTDDEDADPTAQIDTIIPDVARTQGLLRLGWDARYASLEGSARVSAGDRGVPMTGTELGFRGTLRPFPLLTAAGALVADARTGGTATSVHGSARFGPVAGFSLFGGITVGDRWAVVGRDTTYEREIVVEDVVDGAPTERVDTITRVEPRFDGLLTSAGALRAGVEWNGLGATLGVAAIGMDPGEVVPFGLFFDRPLDPLPVGRATGLEAHAALPFPWTERSLYLRASGSGWSNRGGRPYLPEREGRIGLEYHDIRIEGQFEPMIRVEAVHRGPTIVPDPERTGYSFTMPEYTLLDVMLQIRVIDVRAFLIWENPLNNRTALDLPAGVGFQPGQRVIYGARWEFQN